jgi:hypothetical protein
MGFEDELNPIARGRFNSRRVYSPAERARPVVSLLAHLSLPLSRRKLRSHCEPLLTFTLALSPLSPFSLPVSLSLALRSCQSPKHGGSFYNRIYRRTGGTTKRTRGARGNASGTLYVSRDSDCLHERLRSTSWTLLAWDCVELKRRLFPICANHLRSMHARLDSLPPTIRGNVIARSSFDNKNSATPRKKRRESIIDLPLRTTCSRTQ